MQYSIHIVLLFSSSHNEFHRKEQLMRYIQVSKRISKITVLFETVPLLGWSKTSTTISFTRYFMVKSASKRHSCAHSAIYKRKVNFCNTAKEKCTQKKNPVLPDLEKRASSAIFVYTQERKKVTFFFFLLFSAFALDTVEQMTSRFLFIKYSFSLSSYLFILLVTSPPFNWLLFFCYHGGYCQVIVVFATTA